MMPLGVGPIPLCNDEAVSGIKKTINGKKQLNRLYEKMESITYHIEDS
jgi:hypothetical protein